MSRKDLSCYTEANVLKSICTRSDYLLGHESREATCFEWVKLLLYYNFMYNFMFGCISAVFDTFYYLLFSSGSVSQAVMRLNCWFLLIFKFLHIVSSAYIYILADVCSNCCVIISYQCCLLFKFSCTAMWSVWSIYHAMHEKTRFIGHFKKKNRF